MDKRLHSLVAALLAFAAVTAEAALIDRGGGLLYDDGLNITWLQDANFGRGSAFDDGIDPTDGRMTWRNAVAWADQLSYFDPVRDRVWDDWRLPTLGIGGTPFGSSIDGTTPYGEGASGTGSTRGTGWGLPSDADGIWSELGWMHYHNLDIRGSLLFNLPRDLAAYALVQSELRPLVSYWTGLSGACLLDVCDQPSNLNNPDNLIWTFNFFTGRQAETRQFSNGCTTESPNADNLEPNCTRMAWAVRDGDVLVPPARVGEPGAFGLAALALGALAAARSRRAAIRCRA